MIKIKQAIIVEGKYDIIKLSSIVDTLIIPTDGFRIFKDKEKREMIKAVGKRNGVIILTDSDAAGFKIRGFLNSILPKECIKHAYIPNIPGKERRKSEPSKEGLIGVEGVDDEVVVEALKRAGADIADLSADGRRITKYDLYEKGLSGQKDSASKRRRFLKAVNLPERLSSNSLLDVLNSIMTYEEYDNLVKSI